MHRFYLPPDACKDASPILTDREAHHATHVLRLRKGDPLVVLDGAGSELLCDICALSRDRVNLAVTRKKFVSPLPYRVALLQGIPKGKILDTIIQKATELGVHRIVPLLSERTTTHLEPKDAKAKAEKWRLTAIEAIKQCGNAWLPQIETPVTPADYLGHHEECELPLIASLRSDARHPREHFQAFREMHGRNPKSVCVWVGPEGDFTPLELDAIQTAGARPITLGPRVLRSETAAIYCLSVLNYELQSSSPVLRTPSPPLGERE